MSLQRYNRWVSSPFFHDVNGGHEEKSAWIPQLLQRLPLPPEGRILHSECRRGDYSRALAASGFDVTATDLSFENIAAAKEFETDRLHFYQHDLRLPAWISYFDLALNLFDSFGHYTTRREHDDAMRTFAYSLKPGGTLVFDALNVHYAESRLLPNETKNVGNAELTIHRWMDETHFYRKISVMNNPGSAPEEFIEKQAKFTLGDYTDMLSFQNLQVTDVFGDYSFGPYDLHTAPRMIIFARKNGNRETGENQK